MNMKDSKYLSIIEYYNSGCICFVNMGDEK